MRYGGQQKKEMRRNEKQKKKDFVVKILGSFSNWAWEGFQDRWNNIHPCSDLRRKPRCRRFGSGNPPAVLAPLSHTGELVSLINQQIIIKYIDFILILLHWMGLLRNRYLYSINSLGFYEHHSEI